MIGQLIFSRWRALSILSQLFRGKHAVKDGCYKRRNRGYPRGHWPRKGVWGCAALKTPFFTPLLLFARVPFQAKGSVHKTPFWENLEILASTASIFAQVLALKPLNLEIFSSQAPKLGNFQSTSPQIWKFSVHKPPFQREISFRKPPLRKFGPHTPTWKKLSAPQATPIFCFHLYAIYINFRPRSFID